MSNATSTTGLKLQRGAGNGPPETFTTIGEVTDFSGPSESVEQIDVTSFDSTAKEYIASLPDSGEVTFGVNFVGSNAQQQGLRSDLRAGTVRNFKIIIKDDALEAGCTTVAFAAIVKNLDGPTGGVNAPITMKVTLKVSGQPTWTYNT